MKNKIPVICAIIERNNKVLVVQRSATMKLPLKWEFPGGKLEKNESEEACLKREIREELNIEIHLEKRLTPSVFSYPDVSVELIPYIARQTGGNLTLSEHARFEYLSKSDLLDLEWAQADIPIVKEYLAL